MVEVQYPRVRASKPKTRTGCATCKTRRVKCDEAKPHCNRCRKFGVECDGYPSLAPKTRTKKALIVPKQDQVLMPRPPALTRLLPSASAGYQSEIEYLCFKTFQERAATELSGYFDTNIWRRTILQVCHEEEFARHAVVAIGALHTTMELVQSNVYSSPSSEVLNSLGTTHHRVALLHYDRALKLMGELTLRDEESALRCVLLSCLLTTCFENYIGNQDNALAAAQKGVDVLTECLTTIEWCKPVEDLKRIQTRILDDSDNDLLSTFARLEASIIMFDHNRRSPRKLEPLRLQNFPPFPDFPDHFKDVREARMYTDVLARKALIWRDANLQKWNYSNLDFGTVDTEDKSWRIEQFSRRAQREFQHCVKCKGQWVKAFIPFYEATRSFPGSKEYLGASILMIQYVSTNLMTHLPGQNLETYYDRFREDMGTLVDLSRELLESYPVTTSRKAVYTFDDAVVMGLFLVATRSRDGNLRRQAIHLLVKYPRREGLWDGTMASTVASWLMNQEEKGIKVGDFVPEAARLRIVMLNPKFAERYVTVRCSELLDGSSERIEMPDVVLTW
ncbi:uncharacterized protein LY89DRAFT_634700 [Mollisia scopiformis]|uniref:Zn(2)-C6 fungal-type domain-containing protein n=1 Tax=Mollisia scopiformis TaxID=149040 RepID=A0A194XXJ8_MOLSC|nr:uncharacterized protein LY89DRAFT_634700 [Mollisia scopiformis]KUJ24547.1 hypothetical protein LY89DRAFT_634700 [Mollisia scopiformis]